MNTDISKVQDIPLTDLTDDQFKSFFDTYMGEGGIKEQSVVPGTVIDINDDWVTVDINYKAEGLILVDEFKWPRGRHRPSSRG